MGGTAAGRGSDIKGGPALCAVAGLCHG